ncbi:MAG TPA: hypothetical protein VGL64_05945 [Amycolatopsis sp.]
MGDDYFGIQSSSGDEDRTALLEGVSDDLLDGANDALDGLLALRYGDWAIYNLMGGLYEQQQEAIADVFREFSEADIEPDSADGLQSMINSYEQVWKTFGNEPLTDLTRARQQMDSWRGTAAEDVKTYLDELHATYDRMATEISVLESGIIAARDAVWGARSDLNSLAATFKDTAQKWAEEKSKQGEISWWRVLAAAFVTTLTTMLVVAAAPAAVGVEVTLAAKGIQAAAAGAGAGLNELAAEQGSAVEGDSSKEIYESFFEHIDKIRTGMQDSSGRLAANIRAHGDQLPKIPAPPDVSPGESFDPGNFETSNTSKGTEDKVRRENVDIAPDGGLSRPMTPGTLG